MAFGVLSTSKRSTPEEGSGDDNITRNSTVIRSALPGLLLLVSRVEYPDLPLGLDEQHHIAALRVRIHQGRPIHFFSVA
jgi:hypothetical protein